MAKDFKDQKIKVGDRVIYCYCNILYEGVVQKLGDLTCRVLAVDGDPEFPDAPYYDQVYKVKA